MVNDSANGQIDEIQRADKSIRRTPDARNFQISDFVAVISIMGPVLIVVGIKKEKEKNSQKGKKKREGKGFC